MRRAITLLAVVVLLAGPTALAFFQGGYFDEARRIAALAAWLLLAAAAVISPQPLPRSTSGRVALAGLALLTIWTGLSIGWAPLAKPATDALERLLLYTALFGAAAALLRGHSARRATEPALALGTIVVTCYGLLDRVLPGVFHFFRSSESGGRLEQPLTYWNAMGALAAIGALLCVRIAGDGTRPQWMRAATAAAAVPLAVGVWLSYSRGSLAALGVGLLVLAAIALTRAQLAAIAIALVTGAPAAAIANSLDGVRLLTGSQSARESDGLTMLIALVVLGALAAAAIWLAATKPALARPLELPTRVKVAALVAVIAAAGVGLALAARDTGHVALAGANASRLQTLETHRTKYWRVALEHGFADQPLRGVGPGGFGVIWLKFRDVNERVKVAHSLYVETLAELGLVGFSFLLMFVGGVGSAAVRARRYPGPVAALALWATHNALDWDWEMPALTLIGLVLAGLVVAAAETAVAETA